MSKITVCILMYGDHYDLARRCLSSVVDTADAGIVSDIRIGLNAVCEATRQYVLATVRAADHIQTRSVFEGTSNMLKYPMMRHLLYGALPVSTDLVMWFDDDSYVTGGKKWWATVAGRMANADLLGAKYRIRPAGNQMAGVQAQPWYTGETTHNKMWTFITGGWWTAKFQVLRTWNYPWPELQHRGGDVMLGQLVHQQKYRMVNFSEGVMVNADMAGSGHSTAKRRGFDSKPLWYNYPESVTVPETGCHIMTWRST